MKKSIILVGILIMALCAPVMAQSFTDVPTDHWAYTAIQDLANKGFIVGYPDGTFSGKRALTRYEFAMAISRVIAQLPVAPNMGGFATKADVADLQNKIDNIKPGAPASADAASKADLEKVKRLVDEFRDELATLGVDVDAVKREVADLRTRVEAVENVVKNLPQVSVVTNFVARGETTSSDSFGSPVDKNGAFVDADNNILQGIRSLYDMDLIIKGKVGAGTATAVFNTGNYMNWLGSASVPSHVSDSDAPESVTPYYLYANLPMNWGVLGNADVTIGKFPFQLTPYTLKQVDVDAYTNNWKTDSGDYQMFGAAANFKLGPVGFTTFAAKHDGLNFATLAGQGGMAMDFEQSAGVRAIVGVPFAGTLGLNYIVAAMPDNEIEDITADRAAIFGADLKATPFKNIGLNAAWTRMEPQNNDGDKPAGWSDADAWDARLDIPFGKIGLQAGYRQVDPNFSAPGDWGKIGQLFNPVDIKGPMATLTLPVSSKINLTASGEFYTGTDAGFYGGGDFLTSDDNLNRYVANASYAFSGATKLNVGWERVEYRQGDTTNLPYEQTGNWIDLGVEHNFSPNASMKLMYEFLTHDINDNDAKGGIAVTQFTVKF